MTSVAFHIDQLFFEAPGGIGAYVRNLAQGLARSDPALELTLFHARFGPHSAAPEPWLRHFRVEEIPRPIRSLYPSWDLLARPPLPPSLGSLDLLHATNHAAIPPAGPAQRLVVTVHDLAFERFPNLFPRRWRSLYRLGLRATVRRADAIITMSRSGAEDVISLTKVDPGKLHVVPPAAAVPSSGIEPDAVLTRLKLRTPYVLFIGTLEPRKNLVRLVRAYRRVAATGLPHVLVLAGPLGWHHDGLLREIALQGPGEVSLTGPLPSQDLDALYRGASAFVYPSLYEGFGLPVLEAMARGVPTVASNSSSLPEVTGDAAVGVDPRSVREIGAAIERVLTDPDLAHRLRVDGPARAGRFTWDGSARLTLEVYEHVLGHA